MTSKPKFWVVCPDYVSRSFKDRQRAEMERDSFDASSYCPYNDHEVVESVTQPVAANSAWSEDDEDDK